MQTQFYPPFYSQQHQQQQVLQVPDQQHQQGAKQQKSEIAGEQSKPKREHWSPKQTNALVSAWKENFDVLKSKDCNKAWAQILKNVNQHGCQRSLEQVKRKFGRIEETYVKCKDKNKNKTGEGLNTCPYYDDLDRLLCQKKKVNLPEFTEVGAVGAVPDDVETPEPFIGFQTTEPPAGAAGGIVDTEPDDDDYDVTTEPSEQPTAEKRKRKSDVELDESFEYYEELKAEVKAKKQSKENGKERKKTFQEDLIDLQKEQMTMFRESEKQFQEFQKSLLEKQMEADAKEKENERKFFLEFAKVISGGQPK